MMFFKITFHLDGSGLFYDPNEPIHLDALLAWVLAPRQGFREIHSRDEVPGHVRLPLEWKKISGNMVWCASALFPEGAQGEDLRFWRKRFRQGKADISDGSPNLTNGAYRDWNMPIPITLTPRMAAYANGGRKECKKLLQEVRHLGKKRAHGYGKIISMDFDEIPEDWSMVKDGKAMRFLPDENGWREVRVTPPYWNNCNRVKCCEIGDEYTL